MPLYWSGVMPSFQSLSRADTGASDPNRGDLPTWAQGGGLDSSALSDNPAHVVWVPKHLERFSPIFVRQSQIGSVFNPFNPLSTQSLNTADLVAALDGGLAQSQFDVGFRSQRRDFSFDVTYSEKRFSFIESEDSKLYYLRARDIGFRFAAGGMLFNRSNAGQLSMGTGIKVVARRGDELFANVDALAATDLSDSSMLRRQAMALGGDYGFLYHAPEGFLGPFGLQASLAWRDMGGTHFYLGSKASSTRRFVPWPSNPVFGVGLGLPKIRGTIRSAIRLEYSYWERVIPFADKLGVSLDIRMPAAFSFICGLRGGAVSAGLAYRVAFFEVEVGTFAESYGQAQSLKRSRRSGMELRSVF